MIEKTEILKIARNLNLRPDTIEKDYVLSWLLFGINNSEATKSWLFKGGTSLKKCFFNTFRFSEDLDFTVQSSQLLKKEPLESIFKDIAQLLTEMIGIQFYPDRFKFDIIEKSGGISAQGKLHYTGPLGRKNNAATIKLDLTSDEIIVLNSATKKVHHPYSDEPNSGIHATCYAFEEVVAEKIRALAQRVRPRDLYDVVHFFRNREVIENPQLVYNVLGQKCAFKQMEIPTFETINNHEKLDELEPQWENMLAHQLPSLPPISSFWDDLEPFFEWLVGQLRTERLVPASIVRGDTLQISNIESTYPQMGMLNKIQFSAANRVCIKLVYHAKERTVEPLSFRVNTQNGNRLFYGFEREAGHPKSYSISKIESVSITNIPYTEKYPVEISATGLITMPPIRRISTTRASSTRSRPLSQRRRSGQRSSRAPLLSSTVPTYKIKCPFCQKTFKRKSMFDTKLNKHKNQYGMECQGQTGFPA